MQAYKSSLYFLFSLLTLAAFYNYQDIIFKRPQSIHKWRQSDGASLALNYYQNGMHFFQPQTHNLTSDNRHSSANCPSEVPILYYAIALFYKLFGYHDYIFRITNTFLFFLGLFYLFKLYHYLLKDVIWAILLSLLFFTAPVLVYYGNNYLSNTAALSFAIVAWFYFIKYYFERNPKLIFTFLVWFFVAACFKLTSLISLLSIAALFLLEWTQLIKWDRDEKLFKSPARILFWMVSFLGIVFGWILYARSYNQLHDSYYFSTTGFPIWNLSKAEIKGVFENIQTLWLDQYFHFSVYFLFAICALYLIWNFRKITVLFKLILVFILLQIVAFVLLQFWTFADHDYYVIDLYIFPILLIAFFFHSLSLQSPQFFQSRYLKLCFTIFIFSNVVYARQELAARYQSPINDFDANEAIYTVSPYLRQIGINPEDKVISIPDVSHCSLYLMNQKGWTEYTDARFNRESKIVYNQDSAGIQKSIERGAVYLIINGISEITKKPYLKSFCTHLKGRYKSVYIFDLKNPLRNFDPDQRKLEKIYSCDAEQKSSDNIYFFNPADSTQFEFAQTQSATYSHSGKYSSKLDSSLPYGMTLKIPDCKSGTFFSISVWRKAEANSKATLIASSGPNQFYKGDCEIVERQADGWEKLLMQFEISQNLEGQELKIYAYNPENHAVYFDDLEVKQFKAFDFN